MFKCCLHLRRGDDVEAVERVVEGAPTCVHLVCVCIYIYIYTYHSINDNIDNAMCAYIYIYIYISQRALTCEAGIYYYMIVPHVYYIIILLGY